MAATCAPTCESTYQSTYQSTYRSTTWESLEQRVDQLIELTAVLSRENRALKVQQHNWSTERAKLIEKNELAKSRVEAMISRLKSLEQD